MNVAELQFPVLKKFPNGAFQVASSAAMLTRNTSIGLKEGYYDGLEILDSRGRWFRVRSARKLGGVGRFGGLTLFLNRRIRVELDLEDENRLATVEEVKGIILADLEAWDGWKAAGDFDELVQQVKAASSLRDLLAIFAAIFG